MLKIPKKFNIMGREIYVKMRDDLASNENCYGKTYYNRGLIEISSKDGHINTSKDSVGETLYHEILHWIFYLLDEEDLNKNEKLINQISGLLYQIHNTSKY